MDEGKKVGELARSYFGPYSLVAYCENKSAMLDETERLITTRNENIDKSLIICEAAFASEDGLCIVDILRIVDDGYEIIEVKSSTEQKPEHLDDMAFQYHILSNCGIKIKKVSLMYINNQYERIGELDIQKLFTLQDCTTEVLEKQKDISAIIKRIKEEAASETEPDKSTGMHCNKPYSCIYKKYCFPPIEEHPLIIDKEKIQTFLDTLSYPLYFLDFETIGGALPAYDHQKPYQQIPCQYSLHIQVKQDAEPIHLEFLAEAKNDPARPLAERLCKDIPNDVCVLAYHMDFEKGRITYLAERFPDLAPHLMAIHSNIKDLKTPFKKQAWRSHMQRGSNSLKAVVPAMFPDDPELNYNTLTHVHNGDEAMAAFTSLPSLNPEEQQRTRAALLAYCRLDTLVMVRILDKLREAV
jgi:hypothetical protein